MKALKNLILVVAIVLAGLPVKSQENGWIAGVYTNSNNVWTNDVLQAAGLLVNLPLAMLTDGAATYDLSMVDIHYLKMTDNREEIGYKGNHPYGFKAYDLFNDIEFGVKFGWQGAQSPVGGYVYGAYGINQYKLLFLGDENYIKHRIQSWNLGVRVRISPLYSNLEDHGWCPILELGTTYVYNFKYNGPYNSDKDQINNGMRTFYAIGATFGSNRNYDLMLCLDMANYDIFNRNYTPDGGFWYPYANFKDKDMNISLRMNIRFADF